MANDIHIGDFVGLLDGKEKGYVVKIEGSKVWFETSEGFEMVASKNKLVKYDKPKKSGSKSEKKLTVSKTATNTQAEFPETKKPKIRKVKDANFKIPASSLVDSKFHHKSTSSDNIWEVDLHIEELLDDYKHLSNGEIVDIQIKHARKMIEKARVKKIPTLIFIHGKGKGVLRSELHHLLMGYTHLEFYDASFKKYGGGATEVRLYRLNK